MLPVKHKHISLVYSTLSCAKYPFRDIQTIFLHNNNIS